MVAATGEAATSLIAKPLAAAAASTAAIVTASTLAAERSITPMVAETIAGTIVERRVGVRTAIGRASNGIRGGGRATVEHCQRGAAVPGHAAAAALGVVEQPPPERVTAQGRAVAHYQQPIPTESASP